jgi:hypothetical protein
MNLLLENKYGVPSQNFVRKNVLCEKGDEITRFDGTYLTFYKTAHFLCYLKGSWQNTGLMVLILVWCVLPETY